MDELLWAGGKFLSVGLAVQRRTGGVARRGRRGLRAGCQRGEKEVVAGVVLDAWGVAGQLAGGETSGEVVPLFGQRQKEEERNQGWFCNFPKFQGLNCKIKFPIYLGLK